eukprot:3941126-Rhodomonas_salina.2
MSGTELAYAATRLSGGWYGTAVGAGVCAAERSTGHRVGGSSRNTVTYALGYYAIVLPYATRMSSYRVQLSYLPSVCCYAVVLPYAAMLSSNCMLGAGVCAAEIMTSYAMSGTTLA